MPLQHQVDSVRIEEGFPKITEGRIIAASCRRADRMVERHHRSNGCGAAHVGKSIARSLGGALSQEDRRLYLRLAAVSFAALFLELMMIRWVPAVVRLVAYYANLMLISSFLGLGIGSMLGTRRLRLFGAEYLAPYLTLRSVER